MNMLESVIRVEPLGDSGLMIRWAEHDDDLLDKIVVASLALRRVLPSDRFAIVPAFVTLTVHFDVTQICTADATDLVRSALRNASDVPIIVPRVLEIPVCYDFEFAPDLQEVATHCRLSVSEVLQIHSQSDYIVRMIGFSPGFPYLSGLPASIQCPRRATPRLSVPPGSVAIGGSQTGIYPQATPGGWNVIGRTPVRLFDVARTEPCLLAAGDRVRFRPIDRPTFDRLSEELAR